MDKYELSRLREKQREHEKEIEYQRKKVFEEQLEHERKLEEDRQWFEKEQEMQRQAHAERLLQEQERLRQAHAEKLLQEQERLRKLAEREAASPCYAATGEKLLGTYDGEFRNNLPHGEGKFYFDNGDVYIGGFLGGKFHGRGKLICKNGEVRYDGEYEVGLPHGIGTYYYDKNDKLKSYQGTFYRGERQGRGVLIWTNGVVAEGEFVQDSLNGIGVMDWPSGDRYEGAFVNGFREGQGKHTYPDGRLYEGEWKAGKRHGKGTLTYPNGWSNNGEWRDDKPYNGKFRIYSNEIIEYEGEYINGGREGFGVLCNKKGSKIYEGYWRNNQYSGNGILRHYEDEDLCYEAEGTFEAGKLKEGACQEGDIHCLGAFGDNHRFTEGSVSLNGECIFMGNIKANNITITKGEKSIKAIRVMDKNAFIGVIGEQYTVITWDLIDEKDAKSLIGIKNLQLHTGTLTNGYAVISRGTHEECYYKDGNAILIVDTSTRIGNLMFNWERKTGLLYNYQLPINNSKSMVLSGKFSQCLPTGMCTLKNNANIKKVTYIEEAMYENGIRDGKYEAKFFQVQWIYNKPRYTYEEHYFGNYTNGKRDDYTVIKYIIPKKEETEWAGSVNTKIEAHGLGVMTYVNSSKKYGICENGKLLRELSPLEYKIKMFWAKKQKK